MCSGKIQSYRWYVKNYYYYFVQYFIISGCTFVYHLSAAHLKLKEKMGNPSIFYSNNLCLWSEKNRLQSECNHTNQLVGENGNSWDSQVAKDKYGLMFPLQPRDTMPLGSSKVLEGISESFPTDANDSLMSVTDVPRSTHQVLGHKKTNSMDSALP